MAIEEEAEAGASNDGVIDLTLEAEVRRLQAENEELRADIDALDKAVRLALSQGSVIERLIAERPLLLTHLLH